MKSIITNQKVYCFKNKRRVATIEKRSGMFLVKWFYEKKADIFMSITDAYASVVA